MLVLGEQGHDAVYLLLEQGDSTMFVFFSLVSVPHFVYRVTGLGRTSIYLVSAVVTARERRTSSSAARI